MIKDGKINSLQSIINAAHKRKYIPFPSKISTCCTGFRFTLAFRNLLFRATPDTPQRMRILIHAANLTRGGGLAIGQEILLSWIGQGIPVFVLASPAIAKVLEDHRVAADCWTLIPQSPGSSLRAALRFRKKARAVERHFKPDVAFTIFGPPSWRPRVPHLSGFANGLYFSPDPVMPYGQSANGWQRLLHRLRRRLVFRSMHRDVDAIWVETEAASKKLTSLLRTAKDIQVIPNVLSSAFKRADFPEIQAGKKGPFNVLMVAAGHPHKNFSLLNALQYFPEIALRFNFQTTLPEHAFKYWFPNPSACVQNLGPLSGDALVAAYQAADFIFCPSLAEIFSATWLEAMAARRPLLCADLPEARDICREAALYFNGRDPQNAANALLQLAGHPPLQTQLIYKGTARLAALTPSKSRTDSLYEMLLHLYLKKPYA